MIHRESYGQNTEKSNTSSPSLQETALLQQPGHLLVLAFSWLAFQTQVPEVVTNVHLIVEQVKGFFYVHQYIG
jgi:hypothetical protein